MNLIVLKSYTHTHTQNQHNKNIYSKPYILLTYILDNSFDEKIEGK